MKYRLKPIDVEAMQFAGGAEAIGEILDWMDSGMLVWSHEGFKLMTLHGPTLIPPGEWIVRYGPGEFWRCPDKEFRAKYEPLEDASQGAQGECEA